MVLGWSYAEVTRTEMCCAIIICFLWK
jgi:hypothetical protein